MKTAISITIDHDLNFAARNFATEHGLNFSQLLNLALAKHIDFKFNSPELDFKPTHHHKCLRCLREWDSGKENPKMCPYCKSYIWREPRTADDYTRLREYCGKIASSVAEAAVLLGVEAAPLALVVDRRAELKPGLMELVEKYLTDHGIFFVKRRANIGELKEIKP